MTDYESVDYFTIDRATLTTRKYFDGVCACSIGQYMRACGVPVTTQRADEPARRVLARLSVRLYAHEDTLHNLITDANDRIRLCRKASSRRDHENVIVDAFKRAGVTCEFVGEYLW